MPRRGAFTFELHGVKELDRALKELPKAVSKGVLRNAARKALRPVLATARANEKATPRRTKTKDLHKTLRIGTSLKSGQRAARSRHGDVEVFVGSTAGDAHWKEFGVRNIPAEPFMRPAWDANKQQVLVTFGGEIWNELTKAAKRLARRAEAGTLSRAQRRHFGG